METSFHAWKMRETSIFSSHPGKKGVPSQKKLTYLVTVLTNFTHPLDLRYWTAFQEVEMVLDPTGLSGE